MNIKKFFANKNVFIPGGSKGIGKEAAKKLASWGAHVAIFARDREALQNAIQEIHDFQIAQKQIGLDFCADMTDEKQVDKAFHEAYEKIGRPDILINCVGYAYPQYLEKLTLDDFKKNMEINYYGQLIPSLSVIPFMREQKKGHIVFCSSVLGFLGMMGYATYCPTKFALAGLAESLRHELKPSGISISVVYPADTNTPGFSKENETKPREVLIMSEKGGLYNPEIVAHKMLKAIAMNKGQILFGSGKIYWRLMRFFPGLVRKVLDHDLRMARKKMGQKKKQKKHYG